MLTINSRRHKKRGDGHLWCDANEVNLLLHKELHWYESLQRLCGKYQLKLSDSNTRPDGGAIFRSSKFRFGEDFSHSVPISTQ